MCVFVLGAQDWFAWRPGLWLLSRDQNEERECTLKLIVPGPEIVIRDTCGESTSGQPGGSEVTMVAVISIPDQGVKREKQNKEEPRCRMALCHTRVQKPAEGSRATP